jgi:predicted polyphosphate/ATP-dependent NAD kinase
VDVLLVYGGDGTTARDASRWRTRQDDDSMKD